ncbi:PREDICTED: F-box/kelch-repeat protein At3g13680-like [Camelina sativa]|uniref:F-box/kelch-repeat protein At3g13680-like n=1 Tax=Camelina sativa TaxID=90675 RepID=A0ABM0YI86_CAMSA|nr:PREDICTED: F-box/kelch-repeat protein At3g13680-like [Camelina sativa]
MTTISDLPCDLVGEILSRVPLTSLGATRSTCKKWEALSKNQIFGKKSRAAARKQFLGFMMKDARVCSLKFDLQGIRNHGDLVDPSINQVSLLNQVEVHRVFHCDGLLLCVLKDSSRLLVWNPYLGQTRWIEPRQNFDVLDRYAIGYDKKNRNHKILRIFGEQRTVLGYEIYDFSSNSWRVVCVEPPEWFIWSHQRSVSLKGNAFFAAKRETTTVVGGGGKKIIEQDILLCFDFTTERFGPSLYLPFCSDAKDNVTLSCLRDEQLAVLHQHMNACQIMEIWVTTKIDPDTVSWNKFMRELAGYPVDTEGGSFFIDEEKNVAVVFDLDHFHGAMASAHMVGPRRYLRSVKIGKALNIGKLDELGYFHAKYRLPLVCSSYVPSLVQLQINQPGCQKRKRERVYKPKSKMKEEQREKNGGIEVY